jgi:hypothetical protein
MTEPTAPRHFERLQDKLLTHTFKSPRALEYARQGLGGRLVVPAKGAADVRFEVAWFESRHRNKPVSLEV